MINDKYIKIKNIYKKNIVLILVIVLVLVIVLILVIVIF